MRKLTTLCLFMGFSLLLNAQSSASLLVQVAAFDRQVPLDYFKGLDGVFHLMDHNDIHKYYLSGFDSKAEAEKKVKEVKAMGYNAYLIDVAEIRAYCSTQCGGPLVDPTSLHSIFFDFDRSFLRAKSKSDLDRLATLLNQYPEYTTELRAHTDSKGSLTYNEALSMKRANAAKNYLLRLGISANRIKTSTFGENTPIAKNALATGADTPEGRQLNRRVELVVRDASGKSLNIVEDIDVPESLKTDG